MRNYRIVKTFGNKLKELYRGKSPWLIKKEKKERKNWLMKKRFIMKAVFLGKQSFYQLRLQNFDFHFELIEGLFLILECPTGRKAKKVRNLICLFNCPISLLFEIFKILVSAVSTNFNDLFSL